MSTKTPPGAKRHPVLCLYGERFYGYVTESKKGFFCESNECRFGLWKDNKFLTGKKITLSKKMTTALLKEGSYPVKGIFSEKTGRSYDANLTLTDDGSKSIYALDFGKEKDR